VRSSDDVRALFRDGGLQVDAAVAAFSGMYPIGGGYSNIDMPFTRCRAIAQIDRELGVWATKRFGARPVYRLGVWPLERFTIVRLGERFDRVALEDQRFWVHRRHRDVIEGWAGASR
jgi:hypothetical protein